jgi:hypothetical protein
MRELMYDGSVGGVATARVRPERRYALQLLSVPDHADAADRSEGARASHGR